MFKKTLVFSLAVVWLLVGACTIASAAQNVGNASQKGSVLIFPKIDVTQGRDTIIQISNDFSRGRNGQVLLGEPGPGHPGFHVSRHHHPAGVVPGFRWVGVGQLQW